MEHYTIFGGCFHSDIAFPELLPSRACAPDWTLTTLRSAAPSVQAELIGEDTVEGEIQVRAYRTDAGFRLEYDDTGVFDVTSEGAQIVWYAAAGADLDAARLDIIGRVLATALHASHILTLHGSAVAIDGRGIAFLAPKMHGKSTLALALASAGARLLTDDTIPVDAGLPAMIWPGVQTLRLFHDSAERLGPEHIRPEWEQGHKHTLNHLPPERIMVDRVPLAGIYILQPVAAAPETPAVERIPLSDVAAAVTVTRHAKNGALFGKSEAPLLFDRAVAVTQAVPVWNLMVVRDFEKVDDVVRQIFEWHSDAGARSAAQSSPQSAPSSLAR